VKEQILKDKLAAKKKIEARKARAKLLKEQSRKQQGQIPKRMTKAEKKYMEMYGVSPSTLKKTDNRSAIKDKVTVQKADANKNIKINKAKENKEMYRDQLQKIAAKANENKNIKKLKAGDKEKNKSSKSPKDDYTKYSSIAAAKAAGSLYYKDKQGNKKAAVTSSDLEKSGLSLRDYMNMKLGKTRKKLNVGGALKAAPASNTGLKKLPTSVRNKMGYMNKGGTPKKANKGMLVITIGSAKKMKKKKK